MRSYMLLGAYSKLNQVYTDTNLEEELDLVAAAFCEDDENVSIDVAKRSLQLSKIFDWYSYDFGANNGEIAKTLVKYLRGERKFTLQGLIDSENGSVFISHATYDWSTDASDSLSYDVSSVESEGWSLI